MVNNWTPSHLGKKAKPIWLHLAVFLGTLHWQHSHKTWCSIEATPKEEREEVLSCCFRSHFDWPKWEMQKCWRKFSKPTFTSDALNCTDTVCSQLFWNFVTATLIPPQAHTALIKKLEKGILHKFWIYFCQCACLFVNAASASAQSFSSSKTQYACTNANRRYRPPCLAVLRCNRCCGPMHL